MRYSKSIPIIILFIILGFFTHPRVAEAACNFHQLMTSASKDVTNFTSTCTITAVEGVDNPQNTEASTTTNASLTLGTNSAITINNGGTLAVNSISILAGSISMQTGGQIKLNTPLYVADADADGYAVNFTLYTASASGRRRLGLMRNFTTVDCGDASYSTANSCCTVATRYQDADGDTYGNPSVSISACTTAGYVDNASDCNDALSGHNNTLAATYYVDTDLDTYTNGSASAGTAVCSTGATWNASTSNSVPGAGSVTSSFTAGTRKAAANGADCNDTGTNATNVYVSATCYADTDNDNYGTGTAKSCTNNATCSTATWASGGAGTAAAAGTFAANATDCNDIGTNSVNVYTAATCYVDADNDGYGSTTSRSCTNNATCGSATWASVGTGAAASGNFSANATDCNDTGTNSVNTWIAADCYVDLDNDNYGSGTSRSCTNHATCGSATWGSGGVGGQTAEGTAATAGTFSAVNTDCYDANPATTNAELAYPGSTTCSTAARTNGGYDFNCSGTNQVCGTARYTTYSPGNNWIVDENSCGLNAQGEPKCCDGGAITTTSTQKGCGVSGVARGAAYSWWTCGCGGCGVSGYLLGASGTQACQ